MEFDALSTQNIDPLFAKSKHTVNWIEFHLQLNFKTNIYVSK